MRVALPRCREAPTMVLRVLGDFVLLAALAVTERLFGRRS
jgi:hypothetical protein